MAKISVFNFVTLNGFYKGPGGDISWHEHDEEGSKFSEENMSSGNILLFGRVTYQMMAHFWPSPRAYEAFPKVAEGMNNAEKIVFSTTLKDTDPLVAGWKNTRVISKSIVDEIRSLKEKESHDMTILGSGSIVSLFAEHGLIDEYAFMIDPVALGDGTSIFKGIKEKLHLKLAGTKTFHNGSIVLYYETIKNQKLNKH